MTELGPVTRYERAEAALAALRAAIRKEADSIRECEVANGRGIAERLDELAGEGE